MEPSTLCSDAASSVANTQQKYIREAAPVLSQLILHCLQAFKLSQKVDFWKRLEPDSLLFQVHATPPISFNLPTKITHHHRTTQPPTISESLSGTSPNHWAFQHSRLSRPYRCIGRELPGGYGWDGLGWLGDGICRVSHPGSPSVDKIVFCWVASRIMKCHLCMRFFGVLCFLCHQCWQAETKVFLQSSPLSSSSCLWQRKLSSLQRGVSENFDVKLSRLRTPSILHLLRWDVVAEFWHQVRLKSWFLPLPNPTLCASVHELCICM